jgi:hypothetical protein
MNSDYLRDSHSLSPFTHVKTNRGCSLCNNTRPRPIQMNRGISLYFCTGMHLYKYHNKYDIAAVMHSIFSLLWLRQLNIIPDDIVRLISQVLYQVRKRELPRQLRCKCCDFLFYNGYLYFNIIKNIDVAICSENCKSNYEFSSELTLKKRTNVDTHSYVF